ncbi:MAG: hypothetical protein IH571_01955 [Acholeplasmataceae bacterium]|nr:hypothetical protein [Acholeplasmataceae bacterium]
MLGVLFTYFLSYLFDVNAVIGSAMVGLLAHIFLKKYAVEIYCGSFAGMIGIFLFSPLEALLVAVVTGLFFIITRPICNGIGGKLGAIAFVSVGMVAFILQKTFDVFIAYPEFGYELIMLIAMLGAILTYLIQHKLKQTPVFSSSGISLIVGLILGYTSSHGFIFAAAFFAGTFVGMASKEVIPNIYLIAIAGIILGFIYHMTLSDYVGSGGKLGMMAFISVTTTFGIKSLFHYFIENKKHLV